MKVGVYVVVFAAMTSLAWADTNDGVAGRWLTENGKGIVVIAPCGDSICGKIDWLKPPADAKPGDIPLDKHNPDPGLRRHPICGLQIIYGFRPDDPQHWVEGRIYDPESGDTYHAKITLEDPNHLRLRGYVLLPLLGESQIWTRAPPASPVCRVG